MEANIFRIGNLAHKRWIVIGREIAPRNKLVVKIDLVSLQDIFFNNKVKYTPIPLTEEWFLKFGIIKKESFKQYNHPNLIGGFEYCDSRKMWVYGAYKGGLLIEICLIDYVHELQNIFALTGKELETK